jgi:glucose/arabinose dehydrogenase
MFRIHRLAAPLLIAAAVSAVPTLPASAVTLPPGFGDALVATVGAPTALAFTPDGRLLVATQGGALRVVSGGALLPTAALTLGAAVCTNGERGLLGVAIDPQFATNHYIYLYYTFNKNAAGCPTNNATTPVERISRFTLDVPTANVVDPATELVLLDGVSNYAGNHNGGQLRVGPDGYLYAGTGDGGCDYANDSGCQGANDASRDRNILNAKIVRIGRDGSVPPTNPFLGAGTARCNTGPSAPGTICQETFAWGFRNAFRLTFRPSDSALTVNDVGTGAWEEIDLVQAGGDYGYPCREGAHTALSSGKCSPAPPNMLDPYYEYPHAAVTFTTAVNCGSITGGQWVPAGAWPAAYDGTYLFADFNCGAIGRVMPGAPPAAVEFASGLGTSTVVDLLFGPSATGTSLYYTTYAGGGQVRRVDYAVTLPAAATLHSVPPCRVIDTRGADGPALAANGTRTFLLTGRCGVPSGAAALATNVTVTGSTAAGSVRVGPAGTTPQLDTVAFRAGQTRANNAALGLFGTPAGSVTVVSTIPSGIVHVVIDVTGYWQ